MRNIKFIVIHCSATRASQEVTVEDITRWHKARGFKTIGYHFVIYQDGQLRTGRPLSEAGAHVAGFNSTSIGICYIGGLDDVTGKGSDTRTEAQKNTLLELLKTLKSKFPSAKICGHRDFSPDLNHNGKIDKWEWFKECPCFDAIPEYQNL